MMICQLDGIPDYYNGRKSLSLTRMQPRYGIDLT